jgi:DNA (cytosine-5)-methyltransferase 1
LYHSNPLVLSFHLKMNGIDLFCGAGGMSLGASMAGIRILSAVEANQWATQTYTQNHGNVSVLAKRIEQVSRRDFLQVPRSKPLVIFGGPPCRGFSTANQKTRSSKNPDNWLFLEYIRLVKELNPDWVVFENVTGILQTESGRFIEEVTSRLEDLKYFTNQWVLNSADFGVPQRRNRLFVIANRHRHIEAPIGGCEKVTVSDAIADLPRLVNGAHTSWMKYGSSASSTYARSMRGRLKLSANHLVTRNQPYIIRRYAFVPPGGNWRSIPKRMMANYKDRERCHEWIYHRLRPDETSVVIGNYRKNMLIHPLQDRGLSVREAARLQSFPDWFEFTGSIGFQQQQVGNAVPPLLARAVFAAVRQAAGEASSGGSQFA